MDEKKREEILRLLEENGRLTPAEIGIMIGVSEEVCAAAIREMEEDQIICGYHTLVNWDKIQDDYMVAMVELRVTPQGGGGYDKLADYLCQFPQVETLYLMSGGYDFLVIIKGKSIKDLSLFISSKLASIEEVQSTTTHFILTKYKEEGIQLQSYKKDERMVVTP